MENSSNSELRPKPNRLHPRTKYSQDDISKAMDEINQFNVSIRSVGKKYGIPEATLRHKLSGYHPISKKMGPPPLLTDAEEAVIVAYINRSVKRATPVTKRNVLDAVTTIIQQERAQGIDRNKPKNFGEGPKRSWWRLFRKRHPEITFRTPETLTSARRNISERVIRQWFADAYSFFSEEEILDALFDPARNFNIDESGFSLSPKHGKVLSIRGEKHVFEESTPHYKTNITVLACIGADGSLPPPLIIYPRKRISYTMAEQFPEDLPFITGKSEKGYITFETLYEYLCNGFNDWLTENGVQRPIILWTDWHETRNNYFLAKSLQEMQIVLFGLPPNTTHMMQPLDVAVFGPLKKQWTKGAKDFEHENPDGMITQVNFAKVFLPIYYDSITPGNIKAGFTKCGLCPFDPDKPDYSKLQSASAQHEEPSTLFEGIDQGGMVERSSQTDLTRTTHRAAQTLTSSFIDVCTTFLQEHGFAVIPPSTTEDSLHGIRCKKRSMDDMLIDLKTFVPSKDMIGLKQSSPPISRPPSRMSTPQPIQSLPQPRRPTLQPSQSLPQPRTSTPQPSTSSSSTVSTVFKSFNFYPEKREGRGPKKIRTELDKSFAITSTTVINELRKQMDDKKAKLEKKPRRGRGSGRGRGGGGSRKVARLDNSSTSEDEDYIGLLREGNSSDDDLEDLLLSGSDQIGCIKTPLEPPSFESWVGVRIDKVSTSSRGRVTKPFEIHLGRVKEVHEEGLMVSFLREVSLGFYSYPEIEDVSFPVQPEEMVVLEPPVSCTVNRKFGFRFDINVKSSITSILNKPR